MSKSNRLRRHLYNQQVGKCFYCNTQMAMAGDCNADNHCTVDHKVPRIRGGFISIRKYRDNVVAACRKCNNDKDILTADEYAQFPHMAAIVKQTVGRMTGNGSKLTPREANEIVSRLLGKEPAPSHNPRQLDHAPHSSAQSDPTDSQACLSNHPE